MYLKYRNLFLCLLLWLILSVFLQSVYRFHFYHIEQYQLFLFDGGYLLSTLKKTGGLCLLIYEFLVQFFIYPYSGAILTSTLLMTVGILVYSLLIRIDRDSAFVYLFSLLPVLSLLFMHFNFNYFMQGTIAYILMLLLLNVYMKLSNIWWKLACSVIFTPFLFWLAGSVAVLFVFCIFIKELFLKPLAGLLFLIPCVEVLVLAYLSVRSGYIGEYRFAFLPDMYYHKWLEPSGIAIYLSWICLPLVIILISLLRSWKALKGRKKIAGIVLQVLLAGLFFAYGFKTYGDQRSLKFKEMEYYYRTKQFDKVIEMNKGRVSNYLYGCLLNLSLAEKGELADRIFTFEQNGSNSLLIQMNNTNMVAMLLSDIYYAIGHTGASMNMAFEANISSPGNHTGRMLLRLVKTNIIYGEYAVAEKYIALLEKSLYYREQAHNMRKYLYNEEEVHRNPEFNKRRKSLPEDDFLFTAQVNDRELICLTVNNPENRLPVECTGSMFLLMKKMDLFSEMLDTYYGTEVLPVLPLSFQEAVIIMNEREPDSWEKRGVSGAVIARFEQYKKFIIENKNKPGLAEYVKKIYGDTYWHYFMFKKLS